MKKNLAATLLLLVIGIAGNAQFTKDWVPEYGISLNAMNCYTDVEGRVLDPHNFKPSAGIYGGLLFRKTIGLRLEATAGTVTATDAQASKKSLKLRNLDFTSTIKEVSLLAEVHPFKILHSADYTSALSVYLLGGIGYFAFNPKTQLNGSWIYLHPLHTEGEGFSEYSKRPNYKLTTICYPLGGGFQYELSDRFVIRGEAIYRNLRTDYLDDVSVGYIRPALFYKYLSPEDAVLAEKLADRALNPDGMPTKPGSQRGSTTTKDTYYSINLKLGIRLYELRNPTRANYRRLTRVPGCYKF